MSLLADTILNNRNSGTNGDIAIKAALQAVTELNSKTKTNIVALATLTGSPGTANTAMTAVAALSNSTLATDFATQKTSIDAVITALNTKITEINNNFADLQASNNAIIAALKA